MNSHLKQILLKIARLPKADQYWINQQLSQQQKQVFSALKGEQLLLKARGFSKLRSKNLSSSPLAPPLPSYCQLLADKSPLYIAIVLQEGRYSWQDYFLKTFDSQRLISNLLETKVSNIKSSTKKALFQQWQDSISFDSLLRNNHG